MWALLRGASATETRCPACQVHRHQTPGSETRHEAIPKAKTPTAFAVVPRRWLCGEHSNHASRRPISPTARRPTRVALALTLANSSAHRCCEWICRLRSGMLRTSAWSIGACAVDDLKADPDHRQHHSAWHLDKFGAVVCACICCRLRTGHQFLPHEIQTILVVSNRNAPQITTLHTAKSCNFRLVRQMASTCASRQPTTPPVEKWTLPSASFRDLAKRGQRGQCHDRSSDARQSVEKTTRPAQPLSAQCAGSAACRLARLSVCVIGQDENALCHVFSRKMRTLP